MVRTSLNQDILDNLSTAVFQFDEQLKLCSINSAGQNLLFCSARRVHGISSETLFMNNAIAHAIKRAFDTGETITEWAIELNIPGLPTRSIDCMVTPLFDHNENGTRVIVEIINVEGHRRIVREESLQTQYNATRSLVRSLAHEIKNPLGGIRGAAQLLQRELTKESHHEHTRIIIGEVDRLRSLLDRMLGPNSLPHKSNLNIHEVLEYVRHLINIEIPVCLAIDRDYDPSLPEVYADRDQLIQVIINIIRNAVQALEGVGKITLRTRSKRQFTIGAKLHKLVIRVDVIDNGPGIPDELKPDIFYPMITGRSDGSGLGLSIAQSLVQLQNGLIEFTSRPGETIFTVWLPVQNGE